MMPAIDELAMVTIRFKLDQDMSDRGDALMARTMTD